MPEQSPEAQDFHPKGPPLAIMLLWVGVVAVLLVSQWLGVGTVQAESYPQDAQPTITPTADADQTATAISITFQKDVRLTDGIIAVTILIVLIILGGTLIGSRNVYPMLERLLKKRKPARPAGKKPPKK